MFLFLLFFLFFFFSTSPLKAIDKIKIRPGLHSQEFYNTFTGEKFFSRGHNYIVLGKTRNPWDTNPETQMVTAHIQFDPGVYSSNTTDQLLADFKRYHYNTIRIFISTVTIGNPHGPGLSVDFMDNLSDFIKKAANQQIYVLPVLHGLPRLGGYYDNVAQISQESQMESYNLLLMNQIFITRKANYLKTFINELKNRQVPLNSILGYEIGNEILFTINDKPLKNVNYSITTAAGNFNFSNETERQLGINQNLVHWTQQLTDAVKQADPEALVTLSFGDPLNSPNLSYYAGIINPEVVFHQNSPLDFFDIHLYQLLGDLDTQMSRYKIDPNSKKPLIMGEFGVENKFPLSQASHDLKQWQVDSCSRYHFQGWLTWYWPKNTTISDSNLNFWSADEENNAINQVLSPLYRADPCQLINISPTPTPTPPLTSTPLKPGDVNGDQKVNLTDYSLWKEQFILGELGTKDLSSSADFNQDKKVNILDYGIWKQEYLESLVN